MDNVQWNDGSMKKTPQSKKSAAEPSVAKTSPPESSPAADTLPIVGIGASAGGLEALVQFLEQVPPASGLAFVIVQHLDPTRKCFMVDLLQRATPMKVVEITDRMPVQGDHVYVIPPNRDLSILNGVLLLLEPVVARGLRLPIDYFFRSLADDQQERSLGVILSGMGSDGALGLRAIKERAGAVFVQTPASAKCDSMPRSAIDAGLADVVAPPEELPAKILAYLQHVPMLKPRPGLGVEDADLTGLEKVVLLLRTKTGHDFSLYKKSTLYRRIERRMGLQQLSQITDYIRALRESPQELDLLFNELLIGVTSFFRDAPVWEQLKMEVIPALLAQRPDGGMLRAWVPACSTGEEAYSLAIVFREVVEQANPGVRASLQIFATDLDKDAINKARGGLYPANIATDVSAARLHRFFLEEGAGFKVAKEIREMVIFAPQNLVMEPPFTKLDVLSCRNLLIYLETELQKRLFPLFHYSLNPGGILVLGSAESIGQATDLFEPLPGKTRLYRRTSVSPRADQIDFPTGVARARGSAPAVPPSTTKGLPFVPNLEALADRLLRQRYSPAAVLTTHQGDILFFSGKTRPYLDPPSGKTNFNLFAMARPGLDLALNEAFHKAVRQNAEVTLKAIRVEGGRDAPVVDIHVQPLAEPDTVPGLVLVIFEDTAASPTAKAPGRAARHAVVPGVQFAALVQELQQARQELQNTREEMQASQEELKSANEELQSMNEELQSTNEELTTSKEEMQSMNEEMQTTNHELRAKVDESARASDDLKNMLNSSDIATLFLDTELRVRRFTSQTARLIKLIPGDVGRLITDLATELDYPQLAEDARESLRSLVSHERQVPAHDGHWFTVRILPYRTQDNRIDGVVVTFIDIGLAKALEVVVREALQVLQSPATDLAAQKGLASTLEKVLRQAEVVLKPRVAGQPAPECRASADSSAEKKGNL